MKSYSDISELLSDEKIELVVVNTPNNTHFDYAKQVLKAGKHVLIEKPATTTPEEFTELLELAKTSKSKSICLSKPTIGAVILWLQKKLLKVWQTWRNNRNAFAI